MINDYLKGTADHEAYMEARQAEANERRDGMYRSAHHLSVHAKLNADGTVTRTVRGPITDADRQGPLGDLIRAQEAK